MNNTNFIQHELMLLEWEVVPKQMIAIILAVIILPVAKNLAKQQKNLVAVVVLKLPQWKIYQHIFTLIQMAKLPLNVVVSHFL